MRGGVWKLEQIGRAVSQMFGIVVVKQEMYSPEGRGEDRVRERGGSVFHKMKINRKSRNEERRFGSVDQIRLHNLSS